MFLMPEPFGKNGCFGAGQAHDFVISVSVDSTEAIDAVRPFYVPVWAKVFRREWIGNLGPNIGEQETIGILLLVGITDLRDRYRFE